MSTNAIDTQRVTIYRRGEILGNIIKIEASAASIEIKPFAQYHSAVVVTYRAKRQRRDRRYTDSYQPSTLVLSGWGHPEPDSIFGEETLEQDGAMMVSHSRYSSCDSRWQSDFDASIARYIEDTGVEVIADFRGFDTYQRATV